MFTVSTVHYSTELDTYEDGCIGGKDSRDTAYDVSFSSNSLPDLLQMVADHVGVSMKDVELDACEEPGRMDLCRTETVDGGEPSESEIALWREGKFDLYCATYTVYVTTSEPVRLSLDAI